VALRPKQIASRGLGARRLIGCALLGLASGCGPGRERPAEQVLHRERVALGASFVGGRATVCGSCCMPT
jgi:hypothetical protein